MYHVRSTFCLLHLTFQGFQDTLKRKYLQFYKKVKIQKHIHRTVSNKTLPDYYLLQEYILNKMCVYLSHICEDVIGSMIVARISPLRFLNNCCFRSYATFS